MRVPSLDPEQEKRRRFEMLSGFLTVQAFEHPVCAIVEDLHWSDDTSLEFLHYLARRCSAVSFGVILLGGCAPRASTPPIVSDVTCSCRDQ